jgi:hypothetical protein
VPGVLRDDPSRTRRTHDVAVETEPRISREEDRSSAWADLPFGTTRGTLRKRHETIDVLPRRDVVEDLRVFEVVPKEVAMTTPRSEQRESDARFAK